MGEPHGGARTAGGGSSPAAGRHGGGVVVHTERYGVVVGASFICYYLITLHADFAPGRLTAGGATECVNCGPRGAHDGVAGGEGFAGGGEI